MGYIKSPLNYVGGKYKLLSEILPLFPEANTFIDLFGGGMNVSINANCNKVVYNDNESHVVALLKHLQTTDVNESLTTIDNLIEKFDLSKTNAEGFNSLRDFYNQDPSDPMVFYTLVCYAFNNQIRYNKSGQFNMPFGKDRSSFNPTLRKKFVEFVEALHNKDCTFSNKDFRDFDFSELGTDDFVYADPPYFNSVAAYNENGGWTAEHEKTLFSILDDLNNKGIKFALSNNLKYDNPLLKDWMQKYNVHYLNADYSNCSYHKKDKSPDVEVLITNY